MKPSIPLSTTSIPIAAAFGAVSVRGEDFWKPGYWEKNTAENTHLRNRIVRFLNQLRVIQGTRYLLQRGLAVLKSKQGLPPFPALKSQLQAVQGHHNIEPADFEKN